MIFPGVFDILYEAILENRHLTQHEHCKHSEHAYGHHQHYGKNKTLLRRHTKELFTFPSLGLASRGSSRRRCITNTFRLARS